MKPSYLVLALKILAVFPLFGLYGGVTALLDGRLAVGAAIVFGAVLLSAFIMWMAAVLAQLIEISESNSLQ
jgi:heme A synthase